MPLVTAAPVRASQYHCRQLDMGGHVMSTRPATPPHCGFVFLLFWLLPALSSSSTIKLLLFAKRAKAKGAEMLRPFQRKIMK